MTEHLADHELTALALEAEAGPTPRQRDHLGRCPQCRGELGQLQRVVRAAREVSTEDFLTPPPDRVWHSITSELGLGAPPPPASGAAPTPRPAETDTTAAAATGADTAAATQPVPDAHHSGRRTWLRRPALLLAAAGLVAGAALGSAVTARLLDDDAQQADTGPAGQLTPLAVPQAVGTVRVARGPQADGEVTVTVTGLPRTDGYYEVWLMDRSHKRLIAVGVLGPDGTATLPLPTRVDLTGYPLIDVSAQKDNGNPAHSGKSVVRGELPG
ncbi:anti-sigma factor [Streptomyces sp. SYP-A7185]|uniref:anti-sigma factor n=1 Tax=Streptomyces sp. SYP-A7185 TaxID=3040076 RepID=UPI0038F75788